MRCAEMTCASYGTPNSFSLSTACCITSQSEEEPITTPTSGVAAGASAVMSFLVLFSVFEFFAGQAFQRLAVLGAGFFDDIGRQRRRGRRLLPILHGFQVIPHKLLVEGWRRTAGLVRVGRPETRGIGSQHFIHQMQ